MNITEARKWAFESLRSRPNNFFSMKELVAEAEALAEWMVNGEYTSPEPPDELPIGDKGRS